MCPATPPTMAPLMQPLASAAGDESKRNRGRCHKPLHEVSSDGKVRVNATRTSSVPAESQAGRRLKSGRRLDRRSTRMPSGVRVITGARIAFHSATCCCSFRASSRSSASSGNVLNPARITSSIQPTTNAPVRRSVMRSPARIAARNNPGRFLRSRTLSAALALSARASGRSARRDQRHFGQVEECCQSEKHKGQREHENSVHAKCGRALLEFRWLASVDPHG